MTFLKRIWDFISRWSDLTGPVFIFIGCTLLMLLSDYNRTIDENEEELDWVKFPQFFEDRLYDVRAVKQLDPNWEDPDITIVEIDDKTLSKIGTWPIPRKNHARLMRRLQHLHVLLLPEQNVRQRHAELFHGGHADDAFSQRVSPFGR